MTVELKIDLDNMPDYLKDAYTSWLSAHKLDPQTTIFLCDDWGTSTFVSEMSVKGTNIKITLNHANFKLVPVFKHLSEYL